MCQWNTTVFHNNLLYHEGQLASVGRIYGVKKCHFTISHLHGFKTVVLYSVPINLKFVLGGFKEASKNTFAGHI